MDPYPSVTNGNCRDLYSDAWEKLCHRIWFPNNNFLLVGKEEKITILNTDEKTSIIMFRHLSKAFDSIPIPQIEISEHQMVITTKSPYVREKLQGMLSKWFTPCQ